MSHESSEYWTRAHPESVVLDIGGEVGALMLFTTPNMHGREIEVSPVGDDGTRTHTAVLKRMIGGRPVFVAVYPELRAGEYRVWDGGPGRRDRVVISGGEIAELEWW